MKKKLLFSLLLLVTLAAIALYFNYKNKSSTLDPHLTDFAVEDTSAISKIILRNNTDTLTFLRANQGYWKLNEYRIVRHDAIRILLKTLRRLQMKSPVAQDESPAIAAKLKTHGTQIVVYDKQSELKSFYVGDVNSTKTGTYMMLTQTGTPFIMYIPGYPADISPNFSTNESDWRNKTIFNYQTSDIQSIDLIYPQQAQHSFRIEKDSISGSYVLQNPENGQPIPDAKNQAIIRYLSYFQDIKYEDTAGLLAASAKDSIRQATPRYVLSITTTGGKTEQLRAYKIPAAPGTTDSFGRPVLFNRNKMYAISSNHNDILIITYLVFDPLLKKRNYFL